VRESRIDPRSIGKKIDPAFSPHGTKQLVDRSISPERRAEFIRPKQKVSNPAVQFFALSLLAGRRDIILIDKEVSGPTPRRGRSAHRTIRLATLRLERNNPPFHPPPRGASRFRVGEDNPPTTPALREDERMSGNRKDEPKGGRGYHLRSPNIHNPRTLSFSKYIPQTPYRCGGITALPRLPLRGNFSSLDRRNRYATSKKS
jgi:hypothetical protein